MSYEDPSLGQKRVSSELTRRGLFISPAGVRCVWLRHNLETFRKRLKALEDHVSKAGEVVTETQLKSLERAKEEKVSWGYGFSDKT
jgi:hypothetical protein